MKKKKVGRPNLYKESTKAVSFKVPVSKIDDIKSFVKNKLSNYQK